MSVAATAHPANPWLAHAVRIRKITAETPGVATYSLEFEDPAVREKYYFRPGQFNMLYLPGVGEVAISISADPNRCDPLVHTIREAGNVTRSLASLPENAAIGLRGPYGSCWPTEQCVGRDVILVAGGIGLAPLRPVIYDILARRQETGDVTLLMGAREPSGLLFSSEYENWRGQGLNVQVTVDRAAGPWNGHIGVVTTLLDRMPLPNPANTLLMMCGPEVMMWYTIRTALGRHVKPDHIFVSLERNMNCAIGLCGHCQFGPEFLCKNGPVFPYSRVASILRVDDL